jgi:hypothetical protein
MSQPSSWGNLYDDFGGENLRQANDDETSVILALRYEREDGWADGARALQRAENHARRYCIYSAAIASPLIAVWVFLPWIAALIMTALLSVCLAWVLQRMRQKFPVIQREYHHEAGADWRPVPPASRRR